MLLAGEIDAAAIDSTVLELEVEQDERINQELRVIDSLGPSPIPPLVINRRMDDDLRTALQAALIEMQRYPTGAPSCRAGKIEHFAAVQDADYDPIREMARLAQGIRLETKAFG